jgi:hypothetical protein
MKKIVCLLTLTCIGLTGNAQDVMEQINAIKLKGGHLTAQYNHESADSAFAFGARDILHQLNLKGYGVFTFSEIEKKIKHLDMKRGAQVRVFSYLNLADISKKADANVASETITIKPKFEVKEENKPTIPHVDGAKLTPSSNRQNAQKTLDDSPQTKMAQDIMAQKDIHAAMTILKAKKNAGLILAYGPFAKGTNIDEVYIAIFDRTTSVPLAVLSPTQNGKRSNLITKSDDTLSNYHGCKAIWISF